MQYTDEYCHDYLAKVFYYCLRKTGNVHEAEALASDINYDVLTALHRGTIPRSFPAWVWTIAKNRYAKWVASKRRAVSLDVTISDELDEYLQDNTNIEGDIVLSEDLQFLRRELALIRSDYRRILVAHYIEDKSVAVIAREQNLPVGTVKTKLQNSRKQLKEGMNMAREFGKRSYNPEEITFINNGKYGDKGQPWTILTHKLYKNIFLEAYGNPQTAEQIALELGVAMPYMEDELEYLTEQTFLIKEAGKYETSFPIISREAQKKIYDKNIAVTPELTHILENIVDVFSKECEDNNDSYYGNYQDYESAKWTLLMRTFDWLYEDSHTSLKFTHTLRPDNGAWDIVGYQAAYLQEPAFVGQQGCFHEHQGKPDVLFQQYKYNYLKICDNTPLHLTHNEGLALLLISQGKWELCESEYIEKLLSYGYIKNDGEGYIPTILVFDGYSTDKYFSRFKMDTQQELVRLAKSVNQLLTDIWNYANTVITTDLPKHFRDDEKLYRIALACSAYDRGYVLEQAIKDKWLKYDEDTSRVIGAYIVL